MTDVPMGTTVSHTANVSSSKSCFKIDVFFIYFYFMNDLDPIHYNFCVSLRGWGVSAILNNCFTSS